MNRKSNNAIRSWVAKAYNFYPSISIAAHQHALYTENKSESHRMVTNSKAQVIFGIR
jgi:hypothetical protein